MTKALINNELYDYDLRSERPILFGDPKQGYKVEYVFIGKGKLLNDKTVDYTNKKVYFFYKEKKKFNLYQDIIVNNELNTSTALEHLIMTRNFVLINDFKDLLKEYKYKHVTNKDHSKIIPCIYRELIRTHRCTRNIRSFTLSEHVDEDAIEVSVFEVRDLFLHYGEVPFKVDLGFNDLVFKGLIIILNDGVQINFILTNIIILSDDILK